MLIGTRFLRYIARLHEFHNMLSISLTTLYRTRIEILIARYSSPNQNGVTYVNSSSIHLCWVARYIQLHICKLKL